MADNGVLTSIMDITKLKVPDLKRELKSRGLNTNGNKNELIERLQAALSASEKASNESVDDLEEDLLNEDDEDVHLDASESIMSDIDTLTGNLTNQQSNEQQQPQKQEQPDQQSQQQQQPQQQSPKKLKRQFEETAANGENKTSQPTKKVVLNRNNPVIDEKRLSTDSKEGSIKTNDSNDEKRVIKLSGLSAKDRLEMRAKKFDVALGSTAKKIARAERFGIASNSTNVKNNSPIDTKVNTSLDVLKRRAERFGGSVSKAMSNLEVQERLEKRKARFGIVTDADKAKQRLERFKQPVK